MAGLTAGLALPSYLTGLTSPNSDRFGELLPLRYLGKTGVPVTILGVGGFHIHWTTERDGQEVIMTALENGVRFFDTAESYGPHVSEIKFGKFLTPNYRDIVFLMSKSTARDAKTAREHLEGSLRRMKTDYLDLWQVHSLSSPEDVDERISNGVLDVFLEAKSSGKVRFIGFTGHRNPLAHLHLLKRTSDMDIWDASQMPINPLDAASEYSFTRDVLPELVKRDIGVLAMKTLADGRFFARKNQHQWETDTPIVPDVLSIADTQNFAWSLPVSTLITGAENKEFMDEKVHMAREFRKLNESDRSQLIDKVSDLSVYGKLEYYKSV